MRALAAGVCAAVLIACTPAPPPVVDAPAQDVAEPTAPVLTPDGLGPVRIGMTVAEASAALGPDAWREPPPADLSECVILLPNAYPDVQVMAEAGVVTRISAVGPAAPAVAAGVGVGAADADVRAAYPGAVETPAKYEPPPAHDLTIWTVPDERGVRFEIGTDGRVSVLHVGGPSILYVEGCL